MSKRYTVLLLTREYNGGGGGTATTTPGGSGPEGATQLAVGSDLEQVAIHAIRQLRVLTAGLIHGRLPEASAWERTP